MRERNQGKGLSAHAIAGTEVVLLGLDATREAARGLLGFTIRRTGGGPAKWLAGGRTFRDVAAGDERPDSRTAPIQAFLWGDYEARPGTRYTYSVTARYRENGRLVDGETVTVPVTTASPDDGKHDVYFNRGVAGSQAYARLFGKYRRFYLFSKSGREQWKDFIRPDEVPADKAWRWLSRGLQEAMFAFIAQAKGPRYGLRAAVYEFDYPPAVAAFAAALESGADVRIIRHAKTVTSKSLQRGGKVVTRVLPDPIAAASRSAIRDVGIKRWKNTSRWQGVFTERTNTTIAHNKFIVLLQEGKPTAVWTGSTNFTAGGIFGQSNVGHVIRDPEVAARYLAYWEKLRTDPPRKKAAKSPEGMGIQEWNVHTQPDLEGPPDENSITAIFSPRPTTAMLQWYADRMAEAKSSVHFTAAFGVSQQIARELLKAGAAGCGESFLRYVMLESVPGEEAARKRKEAARGKGREAPLDYFDFRDQGCNRIAWGDVYRRRKGDRRDERMLAESLAGLNINVDYLHTKYMLVDPLTNDPLVITGSANFSDNSTTMNDENMLVIRGDTRLADIFLTEFMRLFNHFRERNWFNRLSDKEARTARDLAPDDSWTEPYYKAGTQEYRERLLFA
jgi:phosphatidylserine/phosphatidylglycerophosphate/cardiolipin synthase-like enzyme